MKIKPGMFKPLASFKEIPTKPFIAKASEEPHDDSLCLCLPVTNEMLERSIADGRMHREKFNRAKAVGFTIIAYLYREVQMNEYVLIVVDQTEDAGIMVKEENKSHFYEYEKAYKMMEDLEYALLKEPKYATMYDELEIIRQEENSKRVVDTFNYAQDNSLWEGLEPIDGLHNTSSDMEKITKSDEPDATVSQFEKLNKFV